MLPSHYLDLPFFSPPFILNLFFNPFVNADLLLNCPYQSQYQRNYGLLKSKYQKLIPQTILSAETPFNPAMQERLNHQIQEIVSFLKALSIYEVNSHKNMQTFVISVMMNFHLVPEKLLELKREIFRNNIVNYLWSPEEDYLLQQLIINQQKIHGENYSLPWLEIAKQFNSYLNKAQIRKPSHLQERWRNTLKISFRRGKWKKEEDLNILFFVKRNGTKWSRLAKLFPDRTEHNLKNRFFSILSDSLDLPIRKIKQQKQYLKESVLQKALDDLMGQ